MANVCSSCSTDNAEGALVCRQCGATLAPPGSWSRSLIPEDDTFDPLSAPTLVMQHTAPAALPDIEETQPPEPEGSFGRRLVWGLAGFVVLLGAGVWLFRPTELPQAAAPAAAPASAASALELASPPPASAPASAVVTLAPAEPASAAASAAAAALPAAVPTPAQASPLPAAGPAAAPASAADRRKRIPEPQVRRPVPASAPSAPASEPTPIAAPAPPPAPVQEPVRPRSVAESCAGSNLLTRGFCEHRECGKPELAGDPVCVRLKEAEEARRSRQ